MIFGIEGVVADRGSAILFGYAPTNTLFLLSYSGIYHISYHIRKEVSVLSELSPRHPSIALLQPACGVESGRSLHLHHDFRPSDKRTIVGPALNETALNRLSSLQLCRRRVWSNRFVQPSISPSALTNSSVTVNRQLPFQFERKLYDTALIAARLLAAFSFT